ncbi:unnamed protein product [Rotaria sp. Silwood1]|nr:unnamed protein product [Rotaria sp. Silwood1]
MRLITLLYRRYVGFSLKHHLKLLYKYLFYEKDLQCIESLSLIQLKQPIDIIHYLYDCRVIHRDSNHIKLIDFGPLIYACESFLDLYLKLLSGQGFPYYFYERTFDLICALNIIMAMSNADMKRSIDSFKNLQDVNKVALKSLEL